MLLDKEDKAIVKKNIAQIFTTLISVVLLYVVLWLGTMFFHWQTYPFLYILKASMRTWSTLGMKIWAIIIKSLMIINIFAVHIWQRKRNTFENWF